jgi:hypothetical protein
MTSIETTKGELEKLSTIFNFKLELLERKYEEGTSKNPIFLTGIHSYYDLK